MTQSQFIESIFNHFASTGEWPTVRYLQSKLGTRINARLLAAEIGTDFIMCQEGEEGCCSLNLAALETIPAADGDLKLLADGLRVIALSYAERGTTQVTQKDLEKALTVNSIALRRLGHLLRLLNGPWSGYGVAADGNTYSFQPREDAFFYQDVKNYSDIQEVQTRLETERNQIAERLNYRWNRGKRQLTRRRQGAEWAKMDRQVEEMHNRFSNAHNEEQFQAVGLLCREILISLAEAVHDNTKHPSLDNVFPSPTDAKRRLEAFFDAEVTGVSNEAIRKHAKAAVNLASALQHKRTADYRTTALCAEATVSVINLATIVMDHNN